MSAFSDFLTHATAPWWSGAAGTILGTALGGGITFFTTKRNAEVARETQDLRETRQHVREFATRLLSEANALAMTGQGIKQQAADASGFYAAVKEGRPADEIASTFATASSAFAGLTDQIRFLGNLLRLAGTIEEDAARLVTLLNEIQLIGDDDTTRTAVELGFTALGRRVLGVAVTPQDPRVATANKAYERATLDFVNAVRKHSGLPSQAVTIQMDSGDFWRLLNIPAPTGAQSEQQTGH